MEEYFCIIFNLPQPISTTLDYTFTLFCHSDILSAQSNEYSDTEDSKDTHR